MGEMRRVERTAAEVEQRRRALMQARTVAVTARDWQAMNDLTRKLACLPVKGERDYPCTLPSCSPQEREA